MGVCGVVYGGCERVGEARGSDRILQVPRQGMGQGTGLTELDATDLSGPKNQTTIEETAD